MISQQPQVHHRANARQHLDGKCRSDWGLVGLFWQVQTTGTCIKGVSDHVSVTPHHFTVDPKQRAILESLKELSSVIYMQHWDNFFKFSILYCPPLFYDALIPSREPASQVDGMCGNIPSN